MNRTKDGRIIEKRVMIDKKILKTIILKIKKDKKLNWKEFANYLGVSGQTLKHDWINKGNTIPLPIFKKVLNMEGRRFNDFSNQIMIREAFWGQKINKEKKVNIPNKNSEKFAEFYGVMLGDGCIFSDMKGLAITGDKILEKVYYERYLSPLVKELFGSKPKIYYEKNNRALRLIFYSKRVCCFLLDAGFPIGVKNKGDMRFPQNISKNKKLLSACIRGVMDTDGSISAHPNSKIMIHISITSLSLRKSVMSGLNKIGIRGGEFNKGIMLYGKEKLRLFYQRIGFSNQKNIIKYRMFLKNGKVPNSKETETYLRQENPFLYGGD